MSDVSNWRNKVDWQYFTHEERKTIELLVDRGKVRGIASAVYMGPHRDTIALEREMQKIVDIFNPHTQGFESKVKKELVQATRKDPTLLNNPTVEAEWDKKLRDEFQAHVARVEASAKKRVEDVPNVEEVKLVETEPLKVEDSSELSDEPAKVEDTDGAGVLGEPVVAKKRAGRPRKQSRAEEIPS